MQMVRGHHLLLLLALCVSALALTTIVTPINDDDDDDTNNDRRSSTKPSPILTHEGRSSRRGPQSESDHHHGRLPIGSERKKEWLQRDWVGRGENVEEEGPLFADSGYTQAMTTQMGTLVNNTRPDLLALNVSSPIVQVIYSKGLQGVVLLATTELFFMSEGSSVVERVDRHWGLTIVAGTRALVADEGGTTLVVATPSSITYVVCHSNILSCAVHNRLSSSGLGNITALAGTTSSQLFIGCSEGLFVVNSSRTVITQLPTVAEPVTALALSYPLGYLTIGTGLRLYRYNLQSLTWRWDWVGANIDGNITALSYDASGTILYIGNAVTVSTAVIDPLSSVGAWLFTRLGGQEANPGATAGFSGLPTGNITAMASGSETGSMWLGSTLGLTVLWEGGGEGNYSYWSGPRYFATKEPSVAITSICLNHRADTAYVATSNALTIFSLERWTLAVKAQYYQSYVMPRMKRLGLVSGTQLGAFGNLATATAPPPSSDDIKNTALYLASQAFRYAISKEAEALTEASTAYETLLLAEYLSGRGGFMPASFAPFNTTGLGSGWTLSPTDPAYVILESPSASTIATVLFALPLYHDLVASTVAEQKEVVDFVNNITAYIIDHELEYVTPSGEAIPGTTWAPGVVNNDAGFADLRGTASLQILSLLLSAYRLSENSAVYLNYINALRDNDGYAENMNNCRPTSFNYDDFSNDLDVFVAYYLYYISTTTGDFLEDLGSSLARSWSIVSSEHNPFYTFVTAVIPGSTSSKSNGHERPRSSTTSFSSSSTATSSSHHKKNPLSEVLKRAIVTLEKWPLSMVDWPVVNTCRLDLTLNPLPTEAGLSPQFTRAVFPDERPVSNLDVNPFLATNGGDGLSEVAPTAFLLPYWFGSYYGLITNSTSGGL